MQCNIGSWSSGHKSTSNSYLIYSVEILRENDTMVYGLWSISMKENWFRNYNNGGVVSSMTKKEQLQTLISTLFDQYLVVHFNPFFPSLSA